MIENLGQWNQHKEKTFVCDIPPGEKIPLPDATSWTKQLMTRTWAPVSVTADDSFSLWSGSVTSTPAGNNDHHVRPFCSPHTNPVSIQQTHQPKVIRGNVHFAVNGRSVAKVGNESNWIRLIAAQVCWQAEMCAIRDVSSAKIHCGIVVVKERKKKKRLNDPTHTSFAPSLYAPPLSKKMVPANDLLKIDASIKSSIANGADLSPVRFFEPSSAFAVT